MKNDMYQVAVCEDEEILRTKIVTLCHEILKEMKVEHRVTAYASADELEATLQAGEQFALLCLDILMDGKNGMELARDLRKQDDRTSILFITGSAEFLKDGYRVRPIQYLMKPVQKEELKEAIQTDLRLYHQPRTVTFRIGGKIRILHPEDILYAESRDHGSMLHTKNGEQFLSCSLSRTEETLPSDQFCRCHNSFLVNFAHIREVSGRELFLTDGSTLGIGRRYMEQFQNRFVRYLNQT